MTNDEAMQMARKLSKRIYENAGSLGTAPSDDASEIADLCDYILSGSMKREIENAAIKRAARAVANMPASLFSGNYDAAVKNRAFIRNTIRFLIQPPAQKENGE